MPDDTTAPRSPAANCGRTETRRAVASSDGTGNLRAVPSTPATSRAEAVAGAGQVRPLVDDYSGVTDAPDRDLTWLLCDLMHHAGVVGVDFDAMLANARFHHEAESHGDGAPHAGAVTPDASVRRDSYPNDASAPERDAIKLARSLSDPQLADLIRTSTARHDAGTAYAGELRRLGACLLILARRTAD